MPSGKKARQQRREAAATPARTPPPVRSKGAPALRGPRQASPRVLWGAAAVVVLIAVAVVLGIVLTRNSSNSGGLPKTVTLDYAKTNGLDGTTQVYSLLNGIPQHGNMLGKPNAPVTMIEYIDLQCPYCDQFETQVMPSIVSQFVRPGTLRVEARVLDFIGPDSSRGRNAMIAAGEQGKAFDFAQLLYDNQQTENTGWLNDAMVRAAAISIPGLDPGKLLADQSTSTVTQQASAFDAQATTDKVGQTPTLYVGKTGAKPSIVPIKSPTDKATLVAAINAALGK